MTRVLITGMSGTGKSTVLAELAARGHRVVDTDYFGLSEEVIGRDGSSREQLWREDRLTALLAEQVDGILFVAGCVSNQGRFYDRFDVIVLLSAPRAVLVERFATRVSNEFGKLPAERERILNDLEVVEPMLRNTATIEIDTSRPLSAVADAIEEVARRTVRP